MKLMTSLRIAWRNLGRNRKRTGFALAAIAASQFALLSMNAVMHGHKDGAIASITGPLVGHVQVHAPDWRTSRAVDLTVGHVGETLTDLRAQPGVVRATPRIYSPALAARGEEGHAVMVMGVDQAGESHQQGLLESLGDSIRLADHKVVVGRTLAEQLELQVGAELAVVGQGADGSIANDLYQVAGIVWTPVDVVNRMGIVMSIDDARELFSMPDQAHEIVIYTETADEAAALADRLATRPLLKETEVLDWKRLVPGLLSFLQLNDVAGLIVLGLVFLSATACIANTLLMATYERAREFGMLLALGCGPSRIIRMVILETVAMGLVGVGIGTAAGLLLVAITSHTGLDLGALGPMSQVTMSGLNISLVVTPRLEVVDAIRGVVAVILTAVAVSIWPAVHISRLDPMEALRS